MVNSTSFRLGLIGAGVMCEVLVAGLLEQGLLAPTNIQASDKSADRLSLLSSSFGIQVTEDNKVCAAHADVLVLAVKPQNLAEVLRELNGQVPAHTLVLSIVAGARISALQAGLGTSRIIRSMPNLPCRIRAGVTVWGAAAGVTPEDRARTQQILGTMGREVFVDDERHIDRATAISGSGPAIVAEFIKSMFEAAVFCGAPRGLAHETVLQTVMGTAELIQRSGHEVHVAQLIDEVTSPGGTTSRALQVLKKGHFSATITESVEAAYNRTVELGGQLDASLPRSNSL